MIESLLGQVRIKKGGCGEDDRVVDNGIEIREEGEEVEDEIETGNELAYLV